MTTTRGAVLSPEHRRLLRAALLDGDAGRRAFEKWVRATDVDVLDGVSYRLLPLVYRNAEKLGVEHSTLLRLRGIWRHSWYSNQRLFHGVAPALRALQAAALPVSLLKGAALVADGGVADAGERPMEDVDVLVPFERAHEALAALQDAGWRWDAPVGIDELMRFQHSHPVLGPRGEQVDLHWRPLAEPASTGAMWSRMRPGVLGGVEVLIPSVADQVVLTCAHGVGWFPSPLRWLPDTAMLLRGADSDLWNQIIEAAVERRLGSTVAAALARVAEVSHLEVPDSATDALLSAPTSRIERLAASRKLQGGGTASRYIASFEYAQRLRYDHEARREGPLHHFKRTRSVQGWTLIADVLRGALRASGRLWRGTART